jgi:hypothetical protein
MGVYICHVRERGGDMRFVKDSFDDSLETYFHVDSDDFPALDFEHSLGKMGAGQTMLMLKTLEHFGYKHFDHSVAHGGHCHYFGTFKEDGTTLASHMIEDFLRNVDAI